MGVTNPSPIAGQTVLVTGATGFIGREVVRELAEQGAKVRALVRSRAQVAGLRGSGAEIQYGTLAAPGQALDGVRTVFNFAYDMRAPGGENLSDFDNFLNKMKGFGVKGLVHCSSVVVHDGWPDEALDEGASITPPADRNSYRAAKIAMENRLASGAAEFLEWAVILRPTLVYGPGSRIWTDSVVERLLSGPVVLPERPPEAPENQPFGLCQLIHLSDLAAAAVRSAANAKSGINSFIVSSPETLTWGDYYRGHAAILGTGSVEHRPLAELRAMFPTPEAAETSSGGVPLAARASALARRVIPASVVEGTGRKLRGLTRRRGAVQMPEPWLLELYASTGRCDVSKAASQLGLTGEPGFATRLEEMSGYLRGLK